MDYALGGGVNFLTLPRCIRYQPMKKPTGTEKIIGTWLKKSGKRDEVVASKIAGPNPNFAYMRDTIDFSLKVYSMPR
jgi:aryl-alcohol dehydrogenase-like predicted oxidoreductase